MRFAQTLAAALICVAGAPGTACGQIPDFNRDIRPILSNRCFKCHGPDQNKVQAGLRLESRESATGPLESGSTAIVPGDPDESELFLRITDEDEESRMPPAEFGPRLSEKEIETLRSWIAGGAAYARHWSYVSPLRPAMPVPEPALANWPKNSIDHFVLEQMRRHGLQPSPEADRAVLARRVFLDLTGLPPTIAEVDAFVADTNPQAYERLVEDLLDRPAYGEHWARQWLDLARYADSAGYADDPPRTIWAYRDWVIRALNDNMPFDRFTLEQLAGDLLPDPSDDQLIATAFHRNTQTNNEGGTTDEEYRNVAVVDRVNTTMAVWMGTTMACAQCHHHKYDPISQEDYFRFFAILNNTQDADAGDDGPRMSIYTAEQKKLKQGLEARIASLNQVIGTATDNLVAEQQQWEMRLGSQASWSDPGGLSATRSSGGPIVLQDDQSFLVTSVAEKDAYAVDIPLAPQSVRATSVSAIRLETLPDESLPNRGSGHGDGNFVISQITAQWIPGSAQVPLARYLRISLAGTQKILSLAEVQVLVGGQNVAGQGKATQNSVDFSGPAELAIDGNTDGYFANKSVTHTAISDNPWWELDLQSLRPIEKISVWNRMDEGVQDRLRGFQISLLDEDRREVWTEFVQDAPRPSTDFNPSHIRSLVFDTAVADYEQEKFSATSVLKASSDGTSGWGVGGDTQSPHWLELALAETFHTSDPGVLRIHIEHNSVHANHLVGRFRVRMTSDDATLRRARLPAAIRKIVDLEPNRREPAQLDMLAQFFRANIAEGLANERAQLAAAQKQLAEIQPATTVLVLRELTENRRVTRLQYRGNYLDQGPELAPGFPATFHAIPPEKPIDRKTLADWLVDRSNPLTARVQVNRYWESLFGRGLVATSEEFGSQGELPTHPELLDWLAVDLMENGWDMKSILKKIVTSATYRQSSRISAESLSLDPENRWLSRGPRVRLSAEAVRDQALFVSGLLSPKMFGPPVRPPQPSFGLTAAFGGSTDWSTSEGDDRYRRAIYTTWRRSNPYPSMSTFDAPNREVCTIRRNHTNTPLQSLVTLNDPAFVEAAQSLGRWTLNMPGALPEQIAAAFHRCLLRRPSDAELKALVDLYTESQSEFASQPELALQLATEPLGPLPDGTEVTQAAAMTVVGNVILNLDEMFLKR